MGTRSGQTAPAIDASVARPEQPLRPGHDRQPLLDELAAAGQARARAGTARARSRGRRTARARRAAARRRSRSGTSSASASRRAATGSRPIASPAKQAMQNDVKPARSAAASAGTICERQGLGVERDERRDEDAERSRDDAGEHGVDHEPGGSARARPASPTPRSPTPPASTSPNGVQRYSAASTAATTITMPASKKRSSGTTRPKILIVPVGRIEGADFDVPPKTTIAPACSTSSRPSDAASFASGERVPERAEDVQLDRARRDPPCRRASGRTPGAVESVKPK